MDKNQLASETPITILPPNTLQIAQLGLELAQWVDAQPKDGLDRREAILARAAEIIEFAGVKS